MCDTEIEERNIALVKRVFEELNKGNVELFEELCAPELAFYSPASSTNPRSQEECVEYAKTVLRAFPDMKWDIQDMVAKGDKVILRFVDRGTHSGEWAGIPATGNRVEIGGIAIWRLEDGKFVEMREEYDSVGFMQQLGMELKPKE
jgi:steroid delta-isomerase-like uncharacterized protein